MHPKSSHWSRAEAPSDADPLLPSVALEAQACELGVMSRRRPQAPASVAAAGVQAPARGVSREPPSYVAVLGLVATLLVYAPSLFTSRPFLRDDTVSVVCLLRSTPL